MELIPERLRQALEEGTVVFFCGAGVSRNAGLPTFDGLVESVLEDLLPPRNECEEGSTDALAWEAFVGGHYDEALGILENADEGGYGPKLVRAKVAQRLTKRPRTLRNHLTLVRLAELEKASGRLVTTNFDLLFEKAYLKHRRKEKSKFEPRRQYAPMLPPAKPDTFQGLVYLHGALKGWPDDKQLVLSTADFGAAYMLEGWALRFVVELFRHFHVVFVGYSLEDPTMRYLVSALAAAREANPQQFKPPFAFASFDANNGAIAREKVVREWRLAGITAIPFDRSGKYKQLWTSLKVWGDDHRQGVSGRRQKVAKFGQSPPLPGEGDSTVRELAWALKDAEVARYFAGLEGDRCPKSGWIKPLAKQGLFGLPVDPRDDAHVSGAALVSARLNDHLPMHPATEQLGRWVVRYLGTEDAINWVLRQGGVLHVEFRRQVEMALRRKEENSIAPAAQKLWRVLTEFGYAHAVSEKNGSNLFANFSNPRLAPNESYGMRIFLDRLRPIPVFAVKPDYSRRNGVRDVERASDWYDINVELVGIRGNHEIENFKRRSVDWNGALAEMAESLTTRLSEAMDWWQEFGWDSVDMERTHLEYRSISPHEQNDNAPTWTQLIELARDSRDALLQREKFDFAERLERRWQALPYPVFQRLALNAATEPSGERVCLGIEVLLDGARPALWNLHVLRETLRFLRKCGGNFDPGQLARVTESILEGPPKGTRRTDMSQDQWEQRRDGQVLLRLHKLIESGATLPQSAAEAYERIQGDEPWEPRGDRSEEFVIFFRSGPAAHRFRDKQQLEDFGGMSIEAFVEWARVQASEDVSPWESAGGWSEFVRVDFVAAVELLHGAAEQNVWAGPSWYEVLQASNQADKEQEIASLLRDMPLNVMTMLALPATRWLENSWMKLADRVKQSLWRRMWDASQDSESPEHGWDIDAAVNYAAGILGGILYGELAERFPTVRPGQNEGIPDDLRRDFERLADSNDMSAKLARVRMAPMLFAVYRIDPGWTGRTFFSRMDLANEESFDPYIWEAFFFQARFSEDLLRAFKGSFIGVLRRLELIPERVHDNAISLFIHMAIPPGRGIETEEARVVLLHLGTDGLACAAMALRDIVQGAGDRSLVLWRETVGPWFQRAWPRRPVDRSHGVSTNLAWMALEGGEAYPTIVEEITDVIEGDEHNFVLFELKTKEEDEDCRLVTLYPRASLILMAKVVGAQSDRELVCELLQIIGNAEPEIREHELFLSLWERFC